MKSRQVISRRGQGQRGSIVPLIIIVAVLLAVQVLYSWFTK